MRSASKIIGAAFVALTCALLGPAHGAEITVDTTDPRLPIVVVSGELKQGDHKLFVTRTVSLENALVVFESGGGNLMAGLEIGKAIRLKEFHTYVPGKAMCASACAIAWLGGTERYLARTSSVGFHAAYRTSGGTATESGMGNAMVGAYLNSLGLPSRAIAYMTVAAPDSMQWLTAADAEKLGIDVILLDEPSTVTAPTPAPSAPQAQPPAEKSAEEQRFWAEIERELPNWRQINNDPNFHAWLLSVDDLTGITRQIFLEQAQKSLDAKRVIAFFRTYLALSKPSVSVEAPAAPAPQPSQGGEAEPKTGEGSSNKPVNPMTVHICRPSDGGLFGKVDVNFGSGVWVDFTLSRNSSYAVTGINQQVNAYFNSSVMNTYVTVLFKPAGNSFLILQVESALYSRQPQGTLVATGGNVNEIKVYQVDERTFTTYCRKAKQKRFVAQNKN